MKPQQHKKRLVVGMVILNHVVEDQGKEQKRNAKKRQEEGIGEGAEPGEPVNVNVMVENTVQQYPSGRYYQDAQGEIGVAEDGAINWRSFYVFSVEKKQCPSQHRHEKISDTVEKSMAFSLQVAHVKTVLNSGFGNNRGISACFGKKIL